MDTQEKMDKLLARVDEMIPPLETVRLRPVRGETTVFDSKMGGVPYFPKAMAFPTVREGEFAGKPLRLLAQLNFGSLPKLAGFPTEGILQFFAFPDDLYGADFDDRCNQNFYRIVYHENVITDTSALIDSVPEFDDEEDLFPFEGEFLLIADPIEKMPINEDDHRFWEAGFQAYNELFGTNITRLYGAGGFLDVESELEDALHDARREGYTRIGGYPFFTQTDPRGSGSRHTVLLFQSDSDSSGGGWENQVCWGDMGIANFFITPEDLAKRDFSNVIYNWDCG